MQIKVPELQLRDWLCHVHLPLLHSLPAGESIQIVYKEHDEADNDGQIVPSVFTFARAF
jgi:hypothetical protein